MLLVVQKQSQTMLDLKFMNINSISSDIIKTFISDDNQLIKNQSTSSWDSNIVNKFEDLVLQNNDDNVRSKSLNNSIGNNSLSEVLPSSDKLLQLQAKLAMYSSDITVTSKMVGLITNGINTLTKIQ